MTVKRWTKATREERLLRESRILPNGCREWFGVLAPSGYGRIYDPETQRMAEAHRLAFEVWVGPIPEGLHLDHLCHDPNTCTRSSECPHRRCIEPTHLEPVEPAENTRRSSGALTHCKRGHEFTPDNTYYTTGGNGVRQCKACHKLREREKHRRKLGAAVAGWYEAAPLVAAINTYMDAHETPNTYAAIGRLLGVHGDTSPAEGDADGTVEP